MSRVSIIRRRIRGAWALCRHYPVKTLLPTRFAKHRRRILYVDTFSDPAAKTNVEGLYRAYQNCGVVCAFDYRERCRRWGPTVMNKMLEYEARSFQPDFVHLGKSELLRGRTIRRIKQWTGARVIHFYGDYRPEPQPWVVDLGREVDQTYLYHKDETLIQAHRDAGIRHIGFWWVGVDPAIFHPRNVVKSYDVVFMGSNHAFLDGYIERRALMEAMADAGLQLHLFGKHWEYLASRENVHVHAFVNNREMAEAYNRSKIALGIDPVHDVRMYASWRRPLSAMASGAFHLARKFAGLDEVFVNRRHLVWFETPDQAVALAQHYLLHEQERERIASEGSREVLARHTWDQRVEILLNQQTEENHMENQT